MPVTSVMQSKFNLVGPDESVSEFVWGVAFPGKQLEALVAGEDRKFLGIIRVADAGEVDRDQWSSLKCADLMIKDLEPARLSWTVREVSAAMEKSHLDIYPVVDTGGRIIGVVTEQAIVNVVELLDETKGN
jgi:CBS-domain-containing membrane protein